MSGALGRGAGGARPEDGLGTAARGRHARVRMPGALRVATTVLALAFLMAPGALARSHHPPPPRPNLVISQGRANASGGRIAANFVVANVGSAAAGRSRAALTLRVDGKLARWPGRASAG